MTLTDRLAVIICLLGFLGWALFLTIKYYCFGYYDWDLSLTAQTMWNLSHGSTFVSLYGGHFLANHAELIAFLITPLYYLFPHPLTLVYLNLFSFFLGSLLLYRISRAKIPTLFSLVVMILFIIHPSNIFMLMYEFHFESLSVGLIFAIFYAIQKEKYKLFLLSCLILCSLKENMPLIVFMFGVYCLIFKHTQRMKWGGSAIILGLAVFVIDMYFIIPHYRQNLGSGETLYLYMYADWGKSIPEIIWNIMVHPNRLFKVITALPNLQYLEILFSSCGIFSIFSPQISFIALPVLMQNLLSTTLSFKTVFFHFQSSVIPIIFVGAVYSFSALLPKVKKEFTYLLAAFLLLTGAYQLISYREAIYIRVASITDRLNNVRTKLVHQIPPDAGVISSFETLPHLTQRKYAYAFYSIWNNSDYATRQSPLPNLGNATYALLNFTDAWVVNKYRLEPVRISSNIYNVFGRQEWNILEQNEDIVLLTRSKTNDNSQRLVVINPAIATDSWQTVEDGVNDQVMLKQIRWFHSPEFHTIKMEHIWEALEETSDTYMVQLIIENNESKRAVYVKSRVIGYIIYPSVLWKTGEKIFDQYTYKTEGFPAGEYSMRMLFLKLRDGNIKPILDEGKPKSIFLANIHIK
jgi:uncharacterized membrane protein